MIRAQRLRKRQKALSAEEGTEGLESMKQNRQKMDEHIDWGIEKLKKVVVQRGAFLRIGL